MQLVNRRISRYGILLKHFGFALCVTAFLFSSYAPAVFAISQADINSIENNTPFYNPTACGGANTGTTITINNTAAEAAASNPKITGGATVGYALYNSTGQLLANNNNYKNENYGASITKSLLLVTYLKQLGTTQPNAAQTAVLTGMIEQSSDPDANTVYQQYLKYNNAAIQAVATEAGMTDFKLNTTGDKLYNLGQSQITANDFAKFFSIINTLIPASQLSFALGLLSNITPNAGILQAGLPGTVYSKEGWKPEPGTVDDSAVSGSPNPYGVEGVPYVVNQAAQFSVNGTTYGLAFTVAGTQNEAAGEATIKAITQALITVGTGSGAPQGTLPSYIPDPYNGDISAGGSAHNVAPALVAAIFTEENMTQTATSQLSTAWGEFLNGNYGGNHNPPGAAGVNSGWPTSPDGAEGPFQFEPGTWAEYGNGGDINNLADAAKAAAALLAAGGATANTPPSSWQNAIFSYNHAQWYVDAVMEYYNYYINGSSSATPTPGTGTSTTAGQCNAQVSGYVSCNGATPAGTAGLSVVRQTAVCIAENEYAKWQLGAKNPNAAGAMYAGFRANNPNSFSTYTENRDELWCADFASWVYHEAGYQIPNSGDYSVPSVETIFQDGGGNTGNNNEPGSPGGRWTYHPLANYTPVPGDLAIHYEPGNGLPYVHVNMVVSVNGGIPTLIGGDEVGPDFPDGSVVSEDNYIGDVIGYVAPNATGATD